MEIEIKVINANSQMDYSSNLSNPWFDLISSGEKTVEGRLCRGKFGAMKKGDVVTWFHDGHHVKTVISSVKTYENFESMIRSERLKNVLPGIRAISEGVDVYGKIYKYDDIIAHGVVALRVELV